MPSDFAQGGFGLALKLNGTTVVGVVDVDEAVQVRAFRDITGHDSVAGFYDAEPTGRQRLQPFKCTIVWDIVEATHKAVIAAFNSLDQQTFRWVAPNLAERIQFAGYVSLIGRISKQEEYYQANVEIHPVQAITVTDYDYSYRVLETAFSNLVVYLPLWETSGVVVDNFQGNANGDGEYKNGVQLNWPGIGDSYNKSARLDGINDWIKTYSVTLSGYFGRDQGTILLWAKVSSAAVWTDNTVRYLWRFYIDGSNAFEIFKSGIADNDIHFERTASGALKKIQVTRSDLGWMCIGMTYSTINDELKAYINGNQVGSTQTGLSAMGAGALVEANSCLGASISAPDNLWSGRLAHVAHFQVALSPAQMLDLGSVL